MKPRIWCKPVVCVFFLTSILSYANATGSITLITQPIQVTQSAETQLKKAFRQYTFTTSVGVFDSLLTASRQVNYRPGEVVALCQLARVNLEQDRLAEAEQLVQEAQRLSLQVTSLSDIGWIMGNVGRIRTKNKHYSQVFFPLTNALSARMSALASESSSLVTEPFMEQPPNQPSRHGSSRRPFTDRVYGDNNWFSKSGLPEIMLKSEAISLSAKNYVDKWLDSTINSTNHHPQVVQQLTAKKKIRDASQELSQAFAREGNYAQAYRYFLQYTAYKDSLANEVTSRRLAQLAYNQKMQQKEAQIGLLKKDRLLQSQESERQQQFLLGLVSCLGIFALLSLLLIRNNRQKQTANRQLRERTEALEQTLNELKATQVQLIHAEKMASLGELTAGIAHEIQNPLNFVNNFSEVSIELVDELGEEAQKIPRDAELEQELLADLSQNLKKIHQHGNRASSIVKGMLDHSRTSTGEKQLTDLNELADEYLRLAYHGLRAKDKGFNAELVTEFAPNLGKLLIVPQDMGRVLLNLYNNAFYAVHKKAIGGAADYKPTITVSTTVKDREAELRVKDNGVGIPPALIQKIYQPFFTTKPTGEGTGLGLSISYEIVTKGHGGTMQVVTEQGAYTEMVISLPLSSR